MKVLSRGNYNNRKTSNCSYDYGKEIDYCGSDLEIDEYDIVVHDWSSCGLQGRNYGIICPVCDKFIELDRSKIPEKILQNAKSVTYDIVEKKWKYL